jgi:hypothetical protein
MACAESEVYQRPDPNRRCEVTVTKALQAGQGSDQPPACCRGKPMQMNS